MTHVAFVDDVTLVTHSWVTLKRMILELRDSLAKYGLKLHPSKCKVQCNVDEYSCRGPIEIDTDFSVNVLPAGEGMKFLGTMLYLGRHSTAEVRHRVASAWSKFYALKAMLVHKAASLKGRLRLLAATVGCCLLWGAESWNLKEEDRRLLKTTQNKMTRKMVDVRRGPDEDYVIWVKRATKRARDSAADTGIKFWDQHAKDLKWHWAGHVARRSASEWIWRVTFWRDREWTEAVGEQAQRPLRRRPGRWCRWEDEVHKASASLGWRRWHDTAQDREKWRNGLNGPGVF